MNFPWKMSWRSKIRSEKSFVAGISPFLSSSLSLRPYSPLALFSPFVAIHRKPRVPFRSNCSLLPIAVDAPREERKEKTDRKLPLEVERDHGIKPDDTNRRFATCQFGSNNSCAFLYSVIRYLRIFCPPCCVQLVTRLRESARGIQTARRSNRDRF